MNNDLEKTQIYVGEDEVYLIDGLELDVEFDYISPQEKLGAVLELEDYIRAHQLQPVKASDGYVEAEENTLVYLPGTGDIDHAVCFDRKPKEFEEIHGKESGEAEIIYVKETNCLMLMENEELINVKFYNERTEVPQTKEEERDFVQVLEKDAEKMMKEDHFNKVNLDLQAFGEERKQLSRYEEKSMPDKKINNDLEM